MVDTTKVKHDLDKYFKTTGTVKIDPFTGVVDVDGDVVLKRGNTKKLPVKFGTVSGYFYCYGKNLVSLSGSPRHVGGDFDCYDNQLTSLEGAPNHVGDVFRCVYNPLTSLEGAPDHVHMFSCSYSKLLPVLRLIAYPYVTLLGSPSEVEDIIIKYAGQGKPGALRAAAELIRAGYKENARW